MPPRSAKRIVQDFWATMATNDFFAAAQRLAEDYELIWPQSGEVIQGRDAFAQINTRYPAQGPWRFRINRIVADGTLVVTDVSVTDGALRGTALTFHEVADGLITRQVEYWPDPFDAPSWRAEWVSRTPPDRPAPSSA